MYTKLTFLEKVKLGQIKLSIFFQEQSDQKYMTLGELQVMAPATNIYKPAYPEMDEKESPM